MEKELEYFEITWKIENYFLATLKKNWSLNGPKISVGKPETKWKMTLKSENDTESIQLKFERLDSGTHVVRVNWRVTLKNMRGVILYNKDLETRRVSTKFRCQEIYLKKNFEKKFTPVENTLIIYCQLIVGHDHEDEWALFLKTLTTRNLRFIYANQECDIVIYTKNKLTGRDRIINAHKKVLYSRSSTFKRLIDEGKNPIILELDDCALINVILYIYTGDIRSVLSWPTISLIECLLHLEVKEALQYYVPDYVKLKTNLDVQNYKIKWVVENVSGRTESTTITSPVWNDSISATCWELKLHVERVNEYMRMFLSAESKGNANLIAVGCVVVNCDYITLSKSKELECIYFVEGDMRFQTNVFQSKISQILSLLPDNKLYIIFKIQTLLSDTVSRRESRSR